MFFKEEEYVLKSFQLYFKEEQQIIIELLRTYENALTNSGIKNNNFPEYSIIILSGENIKGYNTCLDLLSKGYYSQCETILKRCFEFLIRMFYFKEFPEDEIKWRNEEKLPNRREMTRRLDKNNHDSSIFPTNSNDFFEHFIYTVGYKQSNIPAHGDFGITHNLMAVDKNSKKYANNFYMGPYYDKKLTKVMITRIICFLDMEMLFLAKSISYDKLKYIEIHNRAFNYVFKRKERNK